MSDEAEEREVVDPGTDYFEITESIVGCARCHGEGHKDLVFTRFSYPLTSSKGALIATHWASCPTNGEPVMLAYMRKSRD